MLIPIPELLSTIKPHVRTLTAAEAQAEQADLQDYLVVDVREPEEVAKQPIRGSVNIPRGVLEMRMSSLYSDADRPIYIHCATGARATLSAEQLQRIGYRRVTVIGCTIDTLSALCNNGNCV